VLADRSPMARRVRLRALIVMVVLTLVTPVALALRLSGVRFPSVGLQHRVGHLIAEPLYAELLRRRKPSEFRLLVLLIPGGACANTAVIDALPRHFRVVTSRLLCALLFPFQRHPLSHVGMNEAVRTATGAALIFREISQADRTRPFLNVPGPTSTEYFDVLDALGIPHTARVMCLHNRERGYSPVDDDMHSYRNSDFQSYIPAIEYAVAQGRVVVRMGDPSMQPIPEMPGLVDYAHSPARSPESDLLLAANCDLFVGNSSGALVMAACQWRPIVALNVAPLGASRAWGPTDICVPKLYRWRGSDDLLSFSEVFKDWICDARSGAAMEMAGVSEVDSSEDEILEAVREMISRIDGRPCELDEYDEELQERFHGYFKPSNYSYYSQTRAAQYFLRKHRDLFR
jgi:putative glycosyltransferase (TIGR04372 family)